MFTNRALAAYLTLILSGLAGGRTTFAQELSPSILRIIPGVVERLHSKDIYERLSVLDGLVIVKPGADIPRLDFPYHNLPASDYSVVVQSILAGNLEQLDERRGPTTWWKLNHIVREFKLKELVKPLTRSLPERAPTIQLDILWTLKALQAVGSVPQIVPLLQSPQEYIRREALDTLVSLRAREAVPSLVALLRDKDEQKRYYALISLVKVNGREAASDVVKLLEDEHENNRYWALDALVKFNARKHAQAVWKLTAPNQQPPTQEYALAALIYFDEPRAIPLAVKKATESDLSRRLEMLDFLVKVKANARLPPHLSLCSKAVLCWAVISPTRAQTAIFAATS